MYQWDYRENICCFLKPDLLEALLNDQANGWDLSVNIEVNKLKQYDDFGFLPDVDLVRATRGSYKEDLISFVVVFWSSW